MIVWYACETCNVLHPVTRKLKGTRSFCGVPCYNKWYDKQNPRDYGRTKDQKKIKCIICDKEFIRKQYDTKTNTCSDECNKKKLTAKSKRWKDKNKDHLKQYASNYERENQAKRLVHRTNRMKRVREAEGFFDSELWMHVLTVCGDKCINPNCEGNSNILTPDHVIPLAPKGNRAAGTNWITNIQPLCRCCNSGKKNHHATDYRNRNQKRSIERVFKKWLKQMKANKLLLKKDRQDVLKALRRFK